MIDPTTTIRRTLQEGLAWASPYVFGDDSPLLGLLGTMQPDDDLRSYGLEWFIDFVFWMILWFQKGLKYALRTISKGPDHSGSGSIFDTPLPGGSGFGGSTDLFALVIRKPGQNSNWFDIYNAVTPGSGAMMLGVALVLLVVLVQVQHIARIFNYSNVYREKRTKRSAWAAGVFIVLWYWIGVFMLFFVDGLVTGLAPQMNFVWDGGDSIISWIHVNVDASAGSNNGDMVRDPGKADANTPLKHQPLFALPAYAIGAISGWALEAIYTLRWILIYIYMYTMPLGLAIWFGNVPYVSAIAERFAKHFFTWALLPLPVAIVIRGYKLIYKFNIGFGSTGEFMLGVMFPVLLLVVTLKTFKYATPARKVVTSTVKQTAGDVNAYVQGTGASEMVVRRNAQEEPAAVDDSVGRRNDNSSQ